MQLSLLQCIMDLNANSQQNVKIMHVDKYFCSVYNFPNILDLHRITTEITTETSAGSLAALSLGETKFYLLLTFHTCK